MTTQDAGQAGRAGRHREPGVDVGEEGACLDSIASLGVANDTHCVVDGILFRPAACTEV